MSGKGAAEGAKPVDQETVSLTDSRHFQPAAQPAGSPTRIGKYEVVSILGRGGMGAVYRAFDPVLERDVALKVMLPQIAGDPEQKQRFEREARAIARLMHPSVVTVYDLGYHTDGSPYIVMELLRGRDLSSVLKSGIALSNERKTSIIHQVLEGLGLAHKRGIVHRDIKPPNIFVTDDQKAKIMDFGIARFTAAAATRPGWVVGTAAYMSPEQVRGESVDERSDLFSTGIVLCELLTGRRPFEAESPMSTMHRIAHEEAVIELPGDPLLEPLLPVLRRALAKKAEERYASAAEFAEALRVSMERPTATEDGPGATRGGETRVAVAAPTLARVEIPGRPPTSPGEPRADPSSLFRILREAYTGSKSGHLHFSIGQGRKSLRILKGQIIHGTSDVDGEHLGDILVRYGLLDQPSLERAVAVVLRERRRLGAVLSELGILGRDRVEEAVGLHVREILFNALDSPGVSFSFEEVVESALDADLICPLSTGEVILEATRRIQDPELVKRILGDTARRLEPSLDPLLRSQRIALTPTDAFVLSRVDGSLSAREIVTLIPLPAEDTERSLFSLLCTGVVDYVPQTTRTRRAVADAATGTPATRTPAPRTSQPSREPTTVRKEAVRAPLPPRSTPPPAAAATPPAGDGLGEKAGATEGAKPTRGVQEIRQLILEMHAKLRHDHFEVLGLERSASEAEVREAYAGFARVLHPDACRDPALADLRDQRDAVFSRLSEAYETLREPGSRAEYEGAYAPSKLRRPKADAPPPAPAPPPPPAAPFPLPPNVAAAAPREDEGPQPLDPRLEPESVLLYAESLIAESKYWDAIGQLESVIPRLKGEGRCHAQVMLARAYLKNPLWVRRAALVLQQVVQANPRDVEAYLLLGETYSKEYLLARARAMYEKVLELEPHNRHARRGIDALAAAEKPA